MFLSFHPSDFHFNISHLQNALQQISSWMTANLLTLNSSKTEFLLIGLKGTLRRTHASAVGITWHCPHAPVAVQQSVSVSSATIPFVFVRIVTIRRLIHGKTAITLQSAIFRPITRKLPKIYCGEKTHYKTGNSKNGLITYTFRAQIIISQQRN